jgi:hypothetical protein
LHPERIGPLGAYAGLSGRSIHHGSGVRRQQGEPKPEHVFFDDVVVATEYIGPQQEAR